MNELFDSINEFGPVMKRLLIGSLGIPNHGQRTIA